MTAAEVQPGELKPSGVTDRENMAAAEENPLLAQLFCQGGWDRR